MDESKKVRILHFSSHYEECGVSTYMEAYFDSMADISNIDNQFFGVSPYETRPMTYEQLTPILQRLNDELQNYDILHIQHEFGLYWHDQFKRIVETGKHSGKKVVVTFHLAPDIAIKPVTLGGLSPRNIVKYLRKRLHNKRMKAYHTTPLQLVDLIIVHTKVAAKNLERFGIDPNKIQIIPHPVYKPTTKKSTEITEQLNRKDGDIIFCISGFIHKYKGAIAAVRALKYLPDNYKLVLIGGVKADSDQVNYEDIVTTLADTLGVRDRLYITGYVKDHEQLKALIAECDIATFPYDKVFYALQSTGSINLAFSSHRPVVAYPTEVIKEIAQEAEGAIVLCETFAYYELARELKRIDLVKQGELSKVFAEKNSWAKAADKLAEIYRQIDKS
jgi:glycosyltransferase involved in cell wall biosynthesis